jgi:hypothetical protein
MKKYIYEQGFNEALKMLQNDDISCIGEITISNMEKLLKCDLNLFTLDILQQQYDIETCRLSKQITKKKSNLLNYTYSKFGAKYATSMMIAGFR